MKEKLISTTILFSLLLISSVFSVATNKNNVVTCSLLEKTRYISILTDD